MRRKKGIYERFFKRPMDFILSLMAIIVLSPVFLIVAILVRVKLGSPIIFKQKRPGLNEKIFTMYKFRTMTDERDISGKLLPDAVRLTKFGKMLRSTSLDELPELFNILNGDMSIVGPRPQLVRDMLFMTTQQRERHAVLPGLTGWAQINGRNNLIWEDKLLYDLDYLKTISIFQDYKIVYLTVIRVVKKVDINSDGIDTAEDLGDYLLRRGNVNCDTYDDLLKKASQLLMLDEVL